MFSDAVENCLNVDEQLFILFTFYACIVQISRPRRCRPNGNDLGYRWVGGSISISWLSPRVPQFGMLIAQKRYGDLDQLFWGITRIVTSVTFLVAASIWGGVCLLNALDHPLAIRFASRLLPQYLQAFPAWPASHGCVRTFFNILACP